MQELTKYKSVEQLKNSSNPADSTSVQSKERHARMERFVNSLKADRSSSNGASANRKNGYGG